MSASGMEQELRVRVSDDAMLAELRVPSAFPSESLTEQFCISLFRLAQVSPDRQLLESIREAISRFGEGPPTEVLIEYRGKTPVAGTDARLEWVEGFDPAAPRDQTADDDPAAAPAEDGDDDSVDYYNQVSYIAVERGDHLATLFPATPGEAGHDVTGKPLEPSAGKELAIKADESVVVGADGRFIAQDAGVLRFRSNTMQVNRCLVVDEYVDFSTGNIDFDGDVKVNRGVRDKFVVRATGNIEIGGLIEAAVIEAGGDFDAKTGMAAKETGRVRIGGNLTAKYLECVQGTVRNNVEIHSGMLHCEIDVCGDLDIQHGAVQGGILRITGTARVGDLGAPSGDKTMVVLGFAPSIQAHLAVADQYIEESERECERISTQLETLKAAGGGHTQSQREELTALMCDLPMRKSKSARVEQKRQLILEHLDQIRKVDLTVEKDLHPGTTVVVDDTAYTFDDPVKGPLWIGWDSRRELIVKDVSSGSTTPISKVARARIRRRPKFDAGELQPMLP